LWWEGGDCGGAFGGGGFVLIVVVAAEICDVETVIGMIVIGGGINWDETVV
jgi:hypothetical protein